MRPNSQIKGLCCRRSDAVLFLYTENRADRRGFLLKRIMKMVLALNV